jgi:isoleucyl-tRNA synthetase
MEVLGPKYGRLLPRLLAALRSGGNSSMQAAARTLQETGKLALNVDGETIVLTPDDVDVEASAREGYVAAEDHGYVAVLDTALTPELRVLQDVRKRANLAIEDSIDTWLVLDAELAGVVERYRSYVSEETLTRALTLAVRGSGVEVEPPTAGYTETVPAAKLGGHEVVVTVQKHL